MRENDVEEDEFGDVMGVETDGVRDDFSELPILSSSWSSPEATREASHDDITVMGSLSHGFRDSLSSETRTALKLQLEDFVANRLLRRAGIRATSKDSSNALRLAGFCAEGSGEDHPGWLPSDGLMEDELTEGGECWIDAIGVAFLDCCTEGSI